MTDQRAISAGGVLRRIFLAAIVAASAMLGAHASFAQTASPTQPPAPPVAPVRAATDDYYGTKVVDPYRYMEDLKSPEVQAWLKAQNDYTRAMLARIPGRQQLLARIRQLDEAAPARVSDVRRLPSGRYFYQKRLASEEVAKLYLRDALEGPEVMLVDPTKLAAAGAPPFVINYYAPSFDGSYVAYGASPGGSEDSVIHIVETAARRETGETIDRGWFGQPSWLPDGRSFLHNRMQKMEAGMPPTERELKSKVYLHVVGTDPEKDPVVLGYEASPKVKIAPTDIPFVVTSPASPYAFGLIAHGVRREITLYVTRLDSLGKPDIPWRKVCDVEDDVTDFAPRGEEIYLLTHKDASRFKIVRTSAAQPEMAHAEIVVPPSEAVIQNLSAAEDALYVQLLDGGVGRLLRIPFSGPEAGKLDRVALPFDGAVSVDPADPRVPGVLLDLTSWTKASKIYAYEVPSRKVTDTGLQPAGPFDDPKDVVSEEVKATSYDGVLIPLSIVHQRGLQLEGRAPRSPARRAWEIGSNPALLQGYGAYGITLDPFFDPKLLAWIERGGIFAVAHVRGGGEYGDDWHLAGKMLTKHNTWRDFIACAEYLVAHKYTSPARLAGEGGSAGGITIGRAITERPDLFAAALDDVGVSDTLRAEVSPNGPPNIPEFGSTKTPEGFKGLYEMSSYDHVKDGTPYPAVMLITGINDPRVAPWEAAKMTARLQAATSSGKPVLLRVDYGAGHGFGSTKSQFQELLADGWSFLLWQFGVPGFQPSPSSASK